MSDPISPAAYAGPEDKTMTVVVYVLYLLGFVTGGATTLIGLVMAYVLKGGAGERAYSHYVFLIRTFWNLMAWMAASTLLFIFGVVLTVVLIGIPLLWLASILFGAGLVLYAVRSVLGLVAAAQDQAYGRPRAWIV